MVSSSGLSRNFMDFWIPKSFYNIFFLLQFEKILISQNQKFPFLQTVGLTFVIENYGAPQTREHIFHHHLVPKEIIHDLEVVSSMSIIMTELSIVIPARGQKVAILCGEKNRSLYTLLNGPRNSQYRAGLDL